MTEQEILAILDRWRDVMQECEMQMEAVTELFGCSPESPLPGAVYALMGAYTNVVGARLGGWEDTLTDWWLTHLFGAEPMGIGWHGGKLSKLENNADMARFIADCNEGG